MIQVKTTSKTQPWSLNLRNRVGDSVTYADKTWINKTGANSEPGVGTDWEIIDVGGEGIPVTGTLSDKPITGNLEIDSNAYIELFQPANPDFGEEYAIKKGIYFGADEFLQMYAYKGSGLEGEEPFRQSVLKMLGHELALEQYFYNGVVQKTVGFLFQEDFISVLGPLKGTEDHSDIDSTNKKVYAQRAYVDKANSYSTDEIKTGGVWIDGKPIYRKVVEIPDFGIGNIFSYFYDSNFKVIDVKTLIKSFDQDTYIKEYSRQHDAAGSIGGIILSSSISTDTNEIYVVFQEYNATTEVWESVFNNNEGVIILEYTKTTD